MTRLSGWAMWGMTCTTVCALLMSPAASAQTPQYTVVELTVGNTTSSQSYDINASGQVVGRAVVDGRGSRAVLWAAGALTDLGSINGSYNAAYAINDASQAVGYSEYISDAHAFLWEDGTLTNLGALVTKTIPQSIAYGINDSGQAVGYMSYVLTPGLRTSRAALWQNGVLSELAAFGDTSCSFCSKADVARAVNGSGQIVGWAQADVGTQRGYVRAALWQNGTVSNLGTLGGNTSAAFGINDSGQIVGRAQLALAAPTYGATRAFVWKDGTMTNLGTLGDTTGQSVAYGINAAGAVVGWYTKPTGAPADDPGRGFLWVNGVMYDLTALVTGSGWTIVDARAINDAGQIAATGRGSDGVDRALLLNPSGFVAPPPAHTLYLAEGATSTFFDTQIALLNPGAITTTATLTFTLGNGQSIPRQITVPARTRVTYVPKRLAGLEAAEFATRVDSHQRLVADRTMSWDATGYGSHSETAVAAPATTWYLAEGATIGGFSLFYLLQNPAATPTTVQVRYLRPSGIPLVKSYVLAAKSRTNIWVNEEDFPGVGKALASAELSAVIESQDGTPIIVERAMYRSNQGRTFNAGHESMGVSAPATDWFLAEGATGTLFDMFVLIANPTATDARVEITYLTVDGTTYRRTFTAPANARSGIWVDQEEFAGVPGKPLASAAVSTTVQSVNGVPLVVERAMWWPGDSSTWHEAHNSAGATTTGTKWAVAEGEVGGTRQHETYLLIANTSGFAGSATVTLMFDNGTSMVKTYALPPSSRTNVAVGPDFGAAVTGRRFGAVIESTGTTPAQIVVERAMYSSAGGVSFAAGTSALATKLQ